MWYLVIGGTLLTLGDIVLKSWMVRELPYASARYAGGLLLYLVAMICLVESFRRYHIAAASVLLVVCNVVILLVVSWLYFGEKISAVQLAGVALALVSVALIELGH